MLRPMKAPFQSVDPAKLAYPVMASYKLDGVRAIAVDGKAFSNTCKLIPNKQVQSMFEFFGLDGFDGELIVGPPNATDTFRRTMSGVMSRNDTPNAIYYVFDAVFPDPKTGEPKLDERFLIRYTRLMRLIEAKVSLHAPIRLVPQQLIKSVEELQAFETEALTHGYEGVMIRSLDGPYKPGPNRCTKTEGYLFKLKRFSDSEAIVLGVEEAFTNFNKATVNELGRAKRSSHKNGLVPAGCVGSLICKDVRTGQEIKVGPGRMTGKERVMWWNEKHLIVGQTIKYKFFPTGSKELPRHPTFLGLRAAFDR